MKTKLLWKDAILAFFVMSAFVTAFVYIVYLAIGVVLGFLLWEIPTYPILLSWGLFRVALLGSIPLAVTFSWYVLKGYGEADQ